MLTLSSKSPKIVSACLLLASVLLGFSGSAYADNCIDAGHSSAGQAMYTQHVKHVEPMKPTMPSDVQTPDSQLATINSGAASGDFLSTIFGGFTGALSGLGTIFGSSLTSLMGGMASSMSASSIFGSAGGGGACAKPTAPSTFDPRPISA